MTGKPNTRNWIEIQIAIVAIILAATLVFWNTFASPDRVRAEEKAAASQAQDPLFPTDIPSAALTPTPLPQVVILFTTPEPNQPNPPSTGGSKNGGNRGGGGGGGRGGGGGGGGGGGS